MTDSNCIFCKIIAKEIPCNKIYEDDTFIAFLDIHPHALGHCVLIPKKHSIDIFDLPYEDQLQLIPSVQNVMNKIKEVLKPSGFNVGWNNGESAGQVVPHLHVHIFPRYENDTGGSMHSIIKNPGKKTVEEVAKLFR